MGKKLRAFPVQLVETGDGVFLKRGCTEVKIDGDGAAEAVKIILEAAAKGGVTREEIFELFSTSSRPAVEDLIDQLASRRLLVAAEPTEHAPRVPESSLDIFYWHFDENAAKVMERLNHRHFLILGVNYISRQLTAALLASGVESFEVLDYPQLRNLRLFDEGGKLKTDQWTGSFKVPQQWAETFDLKSLDCLIATSDFGGQESMREWNGLCVKQNRHFLPVVLQDLVGYVGPLVVPGETACFECLWARQNSQMQNYESQRFSEGIAFKGQGIMGFHPSMASILGDIAAFELTRFYGETLPFRKVGTLLEVNLLVGGLTPRKVLKVPRCVACSPFNKRSSTSPNKISLGPAG